MSQSRTDSSYRSLSINIIAIVEYSTGSMFVGDEYSTGSPFIGDEYSTGSPFIGDEYSTGSPFVGDEYSTRSLFIGDEAIVAFQWVIFTFACQVIALFGIVTNAANTVCFIKQGFKDAVNVSLLGLTIADFGSLITLLFTNICYTPAFNEADLPFDPIEVQYLISAWPHNTFCRISGWITAIITLERCLCITAPLKIKSIVTPRRVSAVITCIFITLFASVAPIYAVNGLDWKFVPGRNRTLLGLVVTENRESIEKVSFLVNNAFLPFSAFGLIIISTLALIYTLHKTSKWRKVSSVTGQTDNVSARNQKVAKMVVMISTLYIICFIPFSILFIAMSVEPELSLDGKYRNIIIIIGGFSFLLESVNSSVNIFLYYHMSSKYRMIFIQTISTTKVSGNQLHNS